jgi:hypothetical protein
MTHQLRFVVLTAAALLLIPTAGTAQSVDLDTVRMGRFDYGKMWTFEYAPQEYFTETYGFEANDAWFERARLAALRIPGCSSSFVSPNGLMVTNHHCVRGRIPAIAQPGERLLDEGFYASSLEEERRIPGYYADQLLATMDVSDEVFGAIDQATTDQEREQVRRRVVADIQGRLQQEYADVGGQIRVQIVGLYNGGRYSAYVFRRFTDIRMVFAAELQMGFFGGDYDNFTYPRYDLDFAFLRVYDENGEPYQTDHYFGWGEGVEEGDAVFLVGNPGPTRRLNTVAQLEFQRDVSVPASVWFLGSRLAVLRAFYAADPVRGEEMNIRNQAFGLSNSLKASIGRLEALNNPAIMARKADAERQLREAIAADPALSSQYGHVLGRIAELQEEKYRLAETWLAFERFGARGASAAIIRRAVSAVQMFLAQQAGAPQDSVDAYRAQLLRIGDQLYDLEYPFLVARLADLAEAFGPNHRVTQVVLAGRSPEETATQWLSNSVLRDQATARQAMEAGTLTRSDPVVTAVESYLTELTAFQQTLQTIVTEERALAADLGRVRFEVYGSEIPPDASSSPRISDGVVRGYEYNGTLAPPYTTFYGLYDRAYAHGPGGDWDLPERWKTPPPDLDLGTPLNFISTTDSYGGNSGSPAFTPELKLVGLNFDRNINGLSRDFIYLPEQGRNVMVDVRAIHASLDKVYSAHRIVQEVTTGQLFRTEAEADANR